MTVTLDTARDTAQQVTTLIIHGERDAAVDLAMDYPDPLVLALVLADLVAHVHSRWTSLLGLTHAQQVEAWGEVLLDVEEWRDEQEATG